MAEIKHTPGKPWHEQVSKLKAEDAAVVIHSSDPSSYVAPDPQQNNLLGGRGTVIPHVFGGEVAPGFDPHKPRQMNVVDGGKNGVGKPKVSELQAAAATAVSQLLKVADTQEVEPAVTGVPAVAAVPSQPVSAITPVQGTPMAETQATSDKKAITPTGIPCIDGGVTKPKHDVVFKLGKIGSIMSRYHEVVVGDACITLVYDTRYDEGSQFVPDIQGENDEPFSIRVGKDKKQFLVGYYGNQFTLGCLEIVMLTVIPPTADRIANQEPL